jgi:hypothetical protein
MKTKNLFIFGAIIVFASIMFSSCEDATDIYNYHIEYVVGNDQGNAIVVNYLAAKGVFTGDKGFTSQLTSENDNKARDLFDAQLYKINREELKDLLDKRDFIHRTRVVFTYIVETGNAVSGYYTIEAKEYVIEPKL